jgi:lipoprotein NlpD
LLSLVSGCASKYSHAPIRPQKKDLIVGVRVYTVKKGDTLYAIGLRSGHGYKRLAYWNNLKSPYKLYVGQKIKLYPVASTKTITKPPTTKQKAKKKRTASQKKTTLPKDRQKLLKLKWQWPLKGKIIKTFAQSGKKGIDIHGKEGQPVRAAESGKVVYSGQGLTGYGNLLIIKHDATFLSAYANNRRLLVKDKEIVNKGQIIAEVGSAAGNKTTLHFEIRKDGKPVNPILYLPK